MQQGFLTVDLGFGDAGKGSVVDFLARNYDAHTVIRYNGGAQAGHRVVAADGREHVFAQFGSGTLAGANTHLSRFMLLDPLAMEAEEQHLHTLGVRDAWARTTIDERALVITPFQRAINRLRELARGVGRHGSCGVGIGETMSDALEHGERALFAGDLRVADRMHAKLQFLREINRAKLRELAPHVPDDKQTARERMWLDDEDWADWLIPAYRDFAARARIVPGTHLYAVLQQPGAVVFEGAQGVLLDEWHGFHPHTTWSTTTLANADTLLREAGYDGTLTRVGITRAYTTRHGAGPLPSEDAALSAALPDACNSFGVWQHGFRVGWLDLVLLRYALTAVGALDYLAVTCLDRLADLPSLNVCRRYRDGDRQLDQLPHARTRSLAHQEQLTHLLARCQPMLEPVADPEALLALLTDDLRVPVGLVSAGPTSGDKRLVL